MKHLYQWMIVLLVLAMFAGCAAPAVPTAVPAPTALPQAAAPTEAPEPTMVPEPTNAPESAQPATIKVWYITSNPEETKLMEEMSGRFEAAHPGVKVEFSPIAYDEALKTWKLAVDSDTGPDVAYIGSGGPFMNATGVAGKLVDLAPYAAERGWDKQISPWENVTTYNPFNGPVYGIPYDYAMVNVFYNKDIFEKLNLEVPKTWAELEVVLQTLKENNITPFTVGGLDKWPVDHYLFTLADTAVPFDEIYTTWRAQKGANYTSPGWVKSLSIMKDWVDKGYFEDGFQGLKYDDARNNFLAGNAAMHIDGTWSTSNVLANAAFEPGFFALPQVDAGLPWHSVLGPNNFWVITKASPNTEAAADYVGYMLSEEVAKAKWAAGDIPMFKFATLPEATSDLQVDIYKATGVTGPGFYMFQNSGSLGQVFEDQTALTLDGKATPEQALAEVQTALDKILAERGIQ